MTLSDLKEGVDMLYFNTIEYFDIFLWHVEQVLEEAENEPTIKPVKLYRNVYLMKVDEEESGRWLKNTGTFFLLPGK